MPVRLFRVLMVSWLLTAALTLASCASSTADKNEPRGTPQATLVDPSLVAAVSGYRRYLNEQTGSLVTTTKDLRDAVAAGNLDAAREAYVTARPFFERIASAATYLPVSREVDSQALHGPVDPHVGFHQIEYGLWVSNTTGGLISAADQLAADAVTLRDQIPTLEMSAMRMTEAYELLDQHPISGRYDQEPYSHTDLVDHQAHVDGSRVVFDALRPAIAQKAPDLALAIESRFADVRTALGSFRRGETYVDYTSLTLPERRKLSQAFDTLSELLSQVKTVLARPRT